ncbi:MAG: hypothetical protein IJD62_07410 [Oscillospiraceae bacterium]|nr:hypothetical protein [Oscillospiraceae bacterium]
MKKLLVLALALLMLCACGAEEPAKQPQNDSKTEEPQEEYADYWAKEIAEKRKIVLEKIKENPDYLAAVPNPSDNEPVPAQPIEGLPECISSWAYDYFNYTVTFEVPEKFYEDDVLRFLTAVRRKNMEPGETFELASHISGTSQNDADTYRTMTVTFSCFPQATNPETGELEKIPNANEWLKATFYIYKENGEWLIEDIKGKTGDFYDWAKDSLFQTLGRFPEEDRWSIADHAICEYAEGLYDFGSIGYPIPQ